MESTPAMLAEQTKSWSPYSKYTILIPPNISKLEIWALQFSRYSSLYWRILCRQQRRAGSVPQTYASSRKQHSQSESLLSFITQWAWNILFCLLDIIVHWIVLFAKWQIRFILFIAKPIFIFRHINRTSKYEVQVDYYTQEPKEDMGGLGLFFNYFFFLIHHLFSQNPAWQYFFIFSKTNMSSPMNYLAYAFWLPRHTFSWLHILVIH